VDLNILGAGASKGLVESLQAQFSAETGVGIHGTFGAVGAIKGKALAGEACDVIILTAAMIDELARSGIVLTETVAPLCQAAERRDCARASLERRIRRLTCTRRVDTPE
jgi:molybdate transport system substrate-binding protein